MMRRAAAIVMANWAREAVPLYRELYAGLPAAATWRDFRRLPVLTAARLRAASLEQQVDTVDDVFRAFTPLERESVAAARPVVTDRDDTDAAFEECRDAFALAGIRRGARVTLLAAPERRYVAAEIADRLGYFGVQAHVLIEIEPDGLARQAAALASDFVVGVGARGTDAVRPHMSLRAPAGPGADLYVVPEAGFVAVRPWGEPSYVPLTRHYLIEAGRGGRLLLTALRRFHQPLIRFELPDRGRVARGRLWLDEVAP